MDQALLQQVVIKDFEFAFALVEERFGPASPTVNEGLAVLTGLLTVALGIARGAEDKPGKPDKPDKP